jgi:outer membrane lipopolysaccharide assembly protein LptE/RlpB
MAHQIRPNITMLAACGHRYRRRIERSSSVADGRIGSSRSISRLEQLVDNA